MQGKDGSEGGRGWPWGGCQGPIMANGWPGGPEGTQKPGWSHPTGLLAHQAPTEEPVASGCFLPLARHSTELGGGCGHQEGEDPVVAGPGLSGRHGEAEAWRETGEEEEELHAGQGLSKTDAAACGGVRGYASGGASELGTPGTCGEGHEGLLLDESALGIQEVLGLETEGLLPDLLVLQHRR